MYVHLFLAAVVRDLQLPTHNHMHDVCNWQILCRSQSRSALNGFLDDQNRQRLELGIADPYLCNEHMRTALLYDASIGFCGVSIGQAYLTNLKTSNLMSTIQNISKFRASDVSRTIYKWLVSSNRNRRRITRLPSQTGLCNLARYTSLRIARYHPAAEKFQSTS